jgi:hypothetical protein
VTGTVYGRAVGADDSLSARPQLGLEIPRDRLPEDASDPRAAAQLVRDELLLAASGGFIAPFLEPELEWDFRVPRVQSINASGHKYGMVFPRVGLIAQYYMLVRLERTGGDVDAGDRTAFHH